MRKAKANKNDYEHLVCKECPICGKKFIPAPQHVYRDRRSTKMVCSWSCVCESERLKMAGIKPNSKKGGNKP